MQTPSDASRWKDLDGGITCSESSPFFICFEPPLPGFGGNELWKSFVGGRMCVKRYTLLLHQVHGSRSSCPVLPFNRIAMHSWCYLTGSVATLRRHGRLWSSLSFFLFVVFWRVCAREQQLLAFGILRFFVC